MLAYSGQSGLERRAVDLSHLVRDLRSLIDHAVDGPIEVELELAEGLPPASVDVPSIQQVVLNLVANASDAVQDSAGGMRIRTGRATPSPALLEDSLLDAPLGDECVFVEVTDGGTGMEPSLVARIFDPFFSTKGPGRGLGLAATLGVLRAHGGTISVESSPGEGTAITIYFPTTDEPVEQVVLLPPEPTPPPAPETILVVDDEEMVRTLARRALENEGHRVLEASGGARAVELFSEHGDEIALVLLDLSMPDMDGRETFDRLRAIREDVAVVLSSGYDQGRALRSISERGFAGFLQKPYTISALRARVREAIEADRSRRAGSEASS